MEEMRFCTSSCVCVGASVSLAALAAAASSTGITKPSSSRSRSNWTWSWSRALYVRVEGMDICDLGLRPFPPRRRRKAGVLWVLEKDLFGPSQVFLACLACSSCLRQGLALLFSLLSLLSLFLSSSLWLFPCQTCAVAFGESGCFGRFVGDGDRWRRCRRRVCRGCSRALRLLRCRWC